MRTMFSALAFASVLGLAPAAAQGTGYVAQGMAFARSTCAVCHAVGPGQMASPIADAPSFQALANNPAITSIALTVALATSHKTMPNLLLTPDETRDVVAYVLSLRGAP